MTARILSVPSSHKGPYETTTATAMAAGTSKSNRFNEQDNNSARDHAFLYISLPSLHIYDVK